MKTLRNFIKNNLIIITTIFIAIFLELTAITYTNCSPYLSNPIYPLIILTTIISIGTLFKNKRIRLAVYSIFLIIQTIINTGFIFLYDSNGTVFEWSMYNQRNDAFGTLETFEIKYEYIFISIITILIYIVINNYFIIKDKIKKYNFKNIKSKLITILFLCSLVILFPYIQILMENKDDYTNKLYSTTSNNYQRIGIIGNTFFQLLKGKEDIISFSDKDLEDIEDFIYEDYIIESKYNGISKDNNLIVILVESMEWFPLTKYPKYSKTLYPNITKLMEEGLIANNFYQKEKTDVSEALAVLGNYPTGKYINYDFYENQYPFSLPNLLKYNDEKMVINSFHANYGNFYNRYKLHNSWGFEQLYAIKDMTEYGVIDEWQHKKGERNLDSITFDAMKEKMFPKDKRFFSYILSFTMHGFYGERNNLKEYYEVLDNLNLDYGNEKNMNEYMRTYMAAMMDFDKAIGSMMNYLKEIEKDDETTIILYSDHHAYYNNLSSYAKNIYDKKNTELYRIPLIIYDQKLTKTYTEDNKTNTINKFTTTSDITPTVLDLFGIKGWKNLYFGNSIMIDNIESIVYSRNYGYFISEDFVGYSLDNAKLDKKIFKDIEKRGLIHLEKLQYIDKIYYSDYFKNNPYKYVK